MNHTIWKFELSTDGLIEMPAGARLLSVQVQHGSPQIWAEVDPMGARIKRKLIVVGTGWPDSVPSLAVFLGTFQTGPMVFHVYDEGEA